MEFRGGSPCGGGGYLERKKKFRRLWNKQSRKRQERKSRESIGRGRGKEEKKRRERVK